MLKVVAEEAAREDLAASLDEIVREGARRMLAAALEDEVAACIAAFAGKQHAVEMPRTRPDCLLDRVQAVENFHKN